MVGVLGLVKYSVPLLIFSLSKRTRGGARLFHSVATPRRRHVLSLLGELAIRRGISLLIGSTERVPHLGVSGCGRNGRTLRKMIHPNRFAIFPRTVNLTTA